MGVVVVAVGGVMLWAGLDAADKVGSVVGAVCGVVGLGLSGYGLVQARRGRSEERSVTNSITGSSVLAPVVQAGSIAVAGDRTVVAGSGGVAVGSGGLELQFGVRPDGAGAVIEVVPEFTNIVEVIRAGLAHEPDLAEAVPALLEFQRFTGLGDDQLGLEALASTPSPSSRADNAFGLALLYTQRSDNDRARELFGQALPLYQQIRDRYSQAVAHAWLARTTSGERRVKALHPTEQTCRRTQSQGVPRILACNIWVLRTVLIWHRPDAGALALVVKSCPYSMM